MLFFVDNIFRFTQAGAEVSALLGRIPSAVGYQPTLATDMGTLQERITSTKKGSITSVQAVYVPADDLTDPAPATTFAHLDATTVLSRQIAELGIYPAVDPLDAALLDPQWSRNHHYRSFARRESRRRSGPPLSGAGGFIRGWPAAPARSSAASSPPSHTGVPRRSSSEMIRSYMLDKSLHFPPPCGRQHLVEAIAEVAGSASARS